MEDPDRQSLAELVAIEDVASLLRSRILSATAGPATSVLVQAARTPALDNWLSEIAGNAVQPSVRAKAYRWLLEGRIVWVAGRKWEWTDLKWCRGRFVPILGERSIQAEVCFVPLLRKASSDRSAMVRRVAVELLIQRSESIGEESFKLAEIFASDASASVAEMGRFALAQLRGRM
jgi:hypothetical protein